MELFILGVAQIVAGVRGNSGGVIKWTRAAFSVSQWGLGNHRKLTKAWTWVTECHVPKDQLLYLLRLATEEPDALRT